MPTPDELRSRAASIFQQLRGGQAPASGGSGAGEDLQRPDEAPPRTDGEEAGVEATPIVGPERAEDAEVESGPDGGIVLTEIEPVADSTDGAPQAADAAEDEADDTEDAEDAEDAELADRMIADRDAREASAGAGGAQAWRGEAELAPAVASIHETLSEATEISDLGAAPGGPEATGAAAPAAAAPSPEPEIPAYRPRHELPRVLAIANQKGGVGKTTTAVNLGAALAELGYRVLVVDLDPQGNATTGLGVNARNLDVSIYDVILHDVPIEDTIEPTSLRNLFVVPATIDLAGAEVELVSTFSRELRLRRAVETLSGEFDFTLIDCPPSLGLLTVNGLAAATEVVVPIQCEYYALEGLGQLLRNVNLVKTNLNPALDVTTIVLTMYDARTRLAEQVVNEVRSHFGDKVCRNVVPRTVRLSEAPSFGQPIIVFDSSSRGAIAYRELAKEVSGGAPQRIG